MFEYDATTTRIFQMPPYFFFAVIGVVFASSVFILLLLRYGYDISRNTKILFLSGAGLLAGAKLFGCLTGLYIALANGDPITAETFLHTGIVFYGGLIGYVLTFLLICKLWCKEIDYRLADLVAVSIPLFHSITRVGCFFAGCCYGVETDSYFSVIYTTYYHEGVITAKRVPIQLVEAGVNIAVFIVILSLLLNEKLRGHLLIGYAIMYAVSRMLIEFFRGDTARGVWNGVSFSQVISGLILITCMILIVSIKSKERKHGRN